jgi:hypothetical protein
MAILNFNNKGTEDINYGRATKESFRTLPKELHKKAQVKLARLGKDFEMKETHYMPVHPPLCQDRCRLN